MKALRSPSQILLLIAAATTLAACRARSVRAADASVPVAIVEQGDVQLKVITRGVLNATHTRPLTVPPVAGALLHIVRLARTGTAVREGDTVLEFDPSQQEYNLAQSRSELAQAEEEIVKAKADAEVQTAEDKTALLKGKYVVRRAELDVSKNEIVSEIDAKKNLLALNEARRALAQLEQDLKSHASSNQAGLTVSEEKRNKARLAMQQAQQNIQNMKVKAPAAGIIVVHGNDNANGGLFFTGMTLPDYQPGDTIGPGSTVADVIDTAEMEVFTEVGEIDRPLLKPEQSALVQIDALPGHTFSGKILSVTGTANAQFWESGSQQKFAVTIHLDRPDLQLRSGFTAKVTLLGDQLSHATSVPREAVFTRGENAVVYLSRAGSWAQQEVKVRAYSEGRAVIEGVARGTVVALVDPKNSSSAQGNRKAASPSFGPGAP